MEKVFNDNPLLNECWQTSDGKCFFSENTAKNHAKDLKEKNVKHLKREGKEEEEDQDLDPTLESELAKLKKLTNKAALQAYAVENEIELGAAETNKEILVVLTAAIEKKFTKTEE